MNSSTPSKPKKPVNRKSLLLTTILGAILLLGALILFMSIEKVPQGYQAVIYSVSGVKEQTKPAGWHIISPLDKAVHYPIRTQTKEYDDLNVATSDGKNLNMDISVNYHVDPTKVVNIFNKFGNADIEGLESGFLRTRVQDGLRQSVAKFSVIETFGVKTSEIKKNTIEMLQDNLTKQGFIVEDIAISSPKADKATQAAIDERVKANQELERAKTDRAIAEENAKKKKIEAEGQAAANEILEKSLSDQIIRKQMIDKWDGKQPITIGSDGVIVDVNK
ncbi:prohibitin family protein [Macrococcus equipercicus]|uniref:Prohibitin family protein n=1 Tax=Macrococcus equipercicus TaxID=69967 RepID=A0A9Q9BJZ3_9STAP|nr:prohibitin family protein [Macrococcus equipercicus]KAA1040043.1 prohibitin family protein [Macrococcus equipercicus]UTH13008.1 prohibitin family protein [Macrococcus equipercicus]